MNLSSLELRQPGQKLNNEQKPIVSTSASLLPNPMLSAAGRVLVACEYSGTVRTAFEKCGWDAWSCDLLDTDIPGKHLIGDALDFINDGWDLLIAPPCTYISYAATKYWHDKGRSLKRIKALNFFAKLWEAPIPHICIENPMGCADSVVARHSQIIHPYYFGDSDLKKTCLWLKNLPKLKSIKETDLFDVKTFTEKPEPIYVDKSGKKRYFTDAISGSAKGGHKRSKTFSGIANAMAEQWTVVVVGSR